LAKDVAERTFREIQRCVLRAVRRAAEPLWCKHPAFYHANIYDFRWEDLGRAGWCLLVEVAPQ